MLGAYRVLEKLGEGGMGEVYLAEDTKLGRRVALKKLTEGTTSDPERRGRFEREARAVAALNHPNIVTIHSVEELDGVVFLTMELVEGKTLTEIIPRQGMSLDQMLKIAIPLADAVGAAHQKGITHRDLKPANVMVGPDGRVKVLDFGLAKLQQDAALQGHEVTMATAHVTGEGRIVGTVAYMSPEQAEGKEVDARSDIFSLGVLLFEIATGERPFKGDTNVSLLSSILKDTPRSLTELRADMPRDLARIIKRCLAKDPEERYQTAKDLRNDLRGLKEEHDSGLLQAPSSMSGSAAAAAPRKRTWVVPAAIAAAVLVALAAAAWFLLRSGRTGDAADSQSANAFRNISLTRLTSTGTAGLAAISPDGRYVVHVVREGQRASLWVRQVATASNVQILPAAEARYDGLTFSPEGDYVYYNAYPTTELWASLYRIPVLGGTPRKILDDVDSPPAFSPDGKRFAFLRGYQQEQRAAVLTANADGSDVRELASRKQPAGFLLTGLAWSPDGRYLAAAGVARRQGAEPEVHPVLVDASTGEMRPVGEPVFGFIGGIGWLSNDRIAFDAQTRGGAPRNNGQIWAASIDDGAARRLTNDLNDYVSLAAGSGGRVLTAVQRETRASLWITGPEGQDARSLSRSATAQEGLGGIDWTPDGRVAFGSVASGNWDVWIADADGGNLRQLTSDPSQDGEPAVSPDGSLIAFVSDRSGDFSPWVMDREGGNVRRLLGEDGWSPEFTPDGQHVIVRVMREGMQRPFLVPVAGGEPKPLLGDPAKVPFQFNFASLSPDGTLALGRYLDTAERGTRTAIVPVDGSAWRKMPGGVGDLHWTGDGRAYEEVRRTDAGSNLWRVPLDGSAPTQLTKFESDEIYVFKRSRDGRRLALSRGSTSSDVVMITGEGAH